MKEKRRAYLCLAAIAVLMCVVVGCGEAPVVPVSGRITLKGSPLEAVTVTFAPIGGGEASSGITDRDGKYELRILPDKQRTGAVVGKHRVTLVEIDPKMEYNMKSLDPGGPGGTGFVPKLPASAPNANDGSIQFDVPAEGTSEANFGF